MIDTGRESRLQLFAVFYISLLAICAELCLALMLSLKAFSHMVYVVISFALLGYGLGSNLYLVLGRRLKNLASASLSAVSLVFVSASLASVALALPHLPVKLKLIYHWETFLTLTLVYGAVALPFVGVGFLIAFLFSSAVRETRRLYFWDLLGAGLGAVAFFPLIGALGPLRALLLLSAIALLPAAAFLGLRTRARKLGVAAILALGGVETALVCLPEPVYVVDAEIGWEWIPGTFQDHNYDEVWRKWHPLGRTDLHRMKGLPVRNLLIKEGGGTFEICIDPAPEFCYFTNCYRAGTPVFGLAPDLLRKEGCQIRPFSQPMEAPYAVLDKPRVLVIGAGGGRDIFMARVHGAAEVTGAEINPATYAAMSPGGVVYEYSGQVYTALGTTIHNIDGRHLVKNRPDRSHELIILNGIDTFAALSSGAYAFAENYLYTEEAIQDYLRVLSDDGMINFNRLFESVEAPRETLRLFVMALDALRRLGVQDPGRHIIVGKDDIWGILLVKRTPFTDLEELKLLSYFQSHKVEPAYAPSLNRPPGQRNPLDKVAAAFREGTEQKFIDGYWADISVVHDDNPFFYKYYRFQFKDTEAFLHPAGGLQAFHVQVVIVFQTVMFILIFIFLPLLLFRRKEVPVLPAGSGIPFVAYFAALGAGFVFIEITLMQRFTLALGSPIYSISVTLATILISTGVGSAASNRIRLWAGGEARMVRILSGLVIAYLLALAFGGTALINAIVPAPFPLRVALSAAVLSPLGIGLGIFFPTGLLLVGERSPETVAWAWGINSGFTVLGSTLSIIIAQFAGFRMVLLVAALLYGIAPLAYGWLHLRFGAPAAGRS